MRAGLGVQRTALPQGSQVEMGVTGADGQPEV